MNNKFLYAVLISVLAIVIWVTFSFYKAYQPKPLVLQGEIDAQTYNISSKIPGRINKVFVKKGDNVKVGDTIFSISTPELEAKLAQAKAAVDAVSAEKEEAYTGARKQEIQAAQEILNKAKVFETLMQKTYVRIEHLYKQGVISQQSKDEIYTKYEASKHDSKAAQQIVNMLNEGTRIEVKNAASAQVRIYEAKVDEVDKFLKEALQHSSYKGEVTQVLIQEGELSPIGFPVVSIIDIDDSWAKFSVREDYLKYFKKGKVFKAKIPALGNLIYEFKVSSIAVMGDYATWRATESGKGFDMKSFEVELHPTKHIDDLRVGMSVLLEL